MDKYGSFSWENVDFGGKYSIFGETLTFFRDSFEKKNAQGGTKGLGPRFTFWGLEIAAI
jgi:hypothetical protein